MAKRHTKRGFKTRTLHTEIPYLHPLPHVMPPYRTSTFVSQSLDAPANHEFPFKYSRIGHPNSFLLERTMASLEEGESAAVAADGMRAISATCMTLLQKWHWGTIIATQPLYSDTYAFFMHDMKMMGRDCLFLNPESAILQLRNYINHAHTNIFADKIPPIDFIFIESPANPTLAVYDIKKLCTIARQNNIPVIVDNTFASPYNQRPLALGADLVVHSLTKYCCGNGAALGGAVIGAEALIEPIRQCIKRTGGHIDPDSAWIIQLGLQTLGIRMREHNRNAMHIARFLSSYKKNVIPIVHYPGLLSHPQHEIAKTQMHTPYKKSGFGGMVSFELCHPECIVSCVEILKETFIELAVSLGSTSTTFAVPARQIHSGLSVHERSICGISDTLIRMSVGTEDINDIKQALSSAFRYVARTCIEKK